MAKKSIFDPSAREGVNNASLDRFMPPPAHARSQMPDELIDGQTAESDEVDPELARQLPPDPTEGPEPVDEIKDALDDRDDAPSGDPTAG